MKRIPKSLLITTALLLLAGVTLVAAASLLAPTLTWNVTPVPKTFPADKACPTGSWLVEGVFQSVTQNLDGTYSYSTTIDGMPVTIEVTTYADNSFDFNIIGGVTPQMFVKGGAGSGYLLYQYEPEVIGALNDGPVSYDTGVHDGYVKEDMYQDVSHLDFCIIPKGYPLTAEKTAFTSYTRTYTWDIDKEYDGTYTGFIGDAAFEHDYEVFVDQTITESLFKVYGTITVYNSNAFPVDTTISDSVGGIAATLACGGSLTVPPNGSATCDYYAYLGTKTDGTNTATITSLNPYVDGAVATAGYTFGEPTTVVGYPTINVTDSVQGSLGLASGDFTFAYHDDFACPTDSTLYVNGVYEFDVPNTATIDETGQFDNANVTVTCYAPVVSKTAFTEWTKEYTWTISKAANPDEHIGFAGDTFTSDYDVIVDRTEANYDYKVNGTIKVKNYHPTVDMILTSLSDDAGGYTGVVDCEGSLVVPHAVDGVAGELNCTYVTAPLASELFGETNTATAVFGGANWTGTAPINFSATPTTVKGYATVNVTDTFDGGMPETLGSASEYTNFDNDQDFACPTTASLYTNGVYTFYKDNQAEITETGQTADERVTVTCYAPVVSKTANEFFTRYWDWEIVKDWDGSYDLFAGDSVTHNYKVSVTPTSTDNDWQVTGTITIYNSHPSEAMVLTSVSDLAGGIDATVSCPSLMVAAAGSLVCAYDTGAQDSANLNPFGVLNTATVLFGGASWFGYADIVFPDDPTSEVDPVITVDDDNLTGEAWSANRAYGEWTYTKDFACSANPDDYTGGTYSYDLLNTATINETDEFDTATVEVTCYAPVLTKDASASYDERHEWAVDKVVDPTSQGGYPGDVLPWTWTVTVGESFVEENFLVTGAIEVTNPAGSPGNMTVSLVDQLNDGTLATVDCGGGATSITVAPNTIGNCSYTAEPGGRTANLNTATGTFNMIDFVATAPVSFVKSVVNGTATVTDDEIGLNELLTAGLGPWEFSRDYSHTCSSNRADYFVGGVYTQITDTILNWAYVHSDGKLQDSDDATTTWTCDASFVDIYKTTNGSPADPSKDIQFALYDANHLMLSTVSTLGNGAALAFPTALVPGEPYTICEYPVPAGYTFEISVNGDLVLTYAGPPGTELPTGEIQCFDFAAEPAGTTVTYSIENRYPGGAPRTPGYWKNWNTCTGGNQQYTAAALGGVEAGVYLLDDLLPQALGSWTVSTCEVGVSVLNAQDVDTGKNMSSDAAYALARSLLAARLNQDAGACVVPTTTTWSYNKGPFLTFEQVLGEADRVLAKYVFDGSGSFLSAKDKRVRADYNYALWLNGIIDGYNNSMFCTGDPSH